MESEVILTLQMFPYGEQSCPLGVEDGQLGKMGHGGRNQDPHCRGAYKDQ